MHENHLVFFSGGTASWYVADYVKRLYGKSKLTLLFTDTLVEDNDLYRFMIETSFDLFEVKYDKNLVERASNLTLVYEDMEKRKEELRQLKEDVQKVLPNFHWLSNGDDIWDVFYRKNFLGNSRIAPCSATIKQSLADTYVRETFDPKYTAVYLGIDWTEAHRTKAPSENWKPYAVHFPLCEEPYVNKIDIIKELSNKGIEAPRLYSLGFSHNNCGGFCVRAGQGHFKLLLEKEPKLFEYHSKREQEFREYIGKDVSILRKQKDGVRYNYTLEDLMKDYERDVSLIDETDIGGCGCFVSPEIGKDD